MPDLIHNPGPVHLKVLWQFANGIDANNRRAHRAFLASVRVLKEGVDITPRSYDERLVEQLASRALTHDKRKIHLRRDEDGRIFGVGGAGGSEGQEGDTVAAAESALLHFSSPRDPATIAAFLRTRVYGPESLVWLEGYQALIRWRQENDITGLYAVP